MHKDEDTDIDDVVIEPEQEDGRSSFDVSADTQATKLKKKLKEAQEKAKENLDGWQRLKADMANGKKEESERLARAKERGAEAVLESLLPALDSFDSAMQGRSWEAVDGAWRQGMEFVHSQLVSALESHGVSAYGVVGDTFTESEYEAAEHIDVADKGQDNKVQKVLRKGYRGKSNTIRPARVVVGVYTNKL